jgi:thiosulfate dehydrogenase [quinone] large subunit
MSTYKTVSANQIPEPTAVRFFFADVRMSWLWLLVRLYAGYEWLIAGWGKLTGRSIAFSSFGKPVNGGAWVFSGHDGAAIREFVQGALAPSTGLHPGVQGWYATFLSNVVLPHARLFAYIVTFGELVVGIALILGLLTGIAALLGVFINMNYFLAGIVSANPILGLLGVLLVLAWRIAGYLGVDHWLLPRPGMSWAGSFRRGSVEPADTSPPPPAPTSTPPEGTVAGPPAPGEAAQQSYPGSVDTVPTPQTPVAASRDSGSNQAERGS